MFYIILLSVIFVDQITKYLAYVFLQPQNTIPVINNFFYLTYLENADAAFDILNNKPWFIIVFTAIIIIAFIFYANKRWYANTLVKIGAALIIGGAVGNLIDRIRLGYVIDFLDFDILPIFNIADIAAVAGTIIIAFMLIFKDKKSA